MAREYRVATVNRNLHNGTQEVMNDLASISRQSGTEQKEGMYDVVETNEQQLGRNEGGKERRNSTQSQHEKREVGGTGW
jgi:hypothetical protein